MLCFRILATGVALAGIALSASAQSGFKVVANPSVSVSNLMTAQLSQIFLKKIGTFPDGSAAVPVDQLVSSPVREAFSQAVHAREAPAVEAYWQKKVFSGRGLPPAAYSSDAQVIAFVKTTPGAIGYVSTGAATEGVKVIAVR